MEKERVEFSDATIEKAWQRSGGFCECKEDEHLYHKSGSRCNRRLSKDKRGRENSGSDKWEAHHKNPDGEDVLSNCLIYCWHCHKRTFGDSKSTVAEILKPIIDSHKKQNR